MNKIPDNELPRKDGSDLIDAIKRGGDGRITELAYKKLPGWTLWENWVEFDQTGTTGPMIVKRQSITSIMLNSSGDLQINTIDGETLYLAVEKPKALMILLLTDAKRGISGLVDDDGKDSIPF